jgi:hypothetical protein
MFFTTISIATIVIAFFTCRKKASKETDDVRKRDIFSVWSFDGRMAFEDIINATESFDENHCIGEGSYGRIYKAELQDGQVVAVKKLHARDEEAHDEERFQHEIEMLTKIRSIEVENLWFRRISGFRRLSSCCWLEAKKAVEFMIPTPRIPTVGAN